MGLGRPYILYITAANDAYKYKPGLPRKRLAKVWYSKLTHEGAYNADRLGASRIDKCDPILRLHGCLPPGVE